jgi:hypothetical protein
MITNPQPLREGFEELYEVSNMGRVRRTAAYKSTGVTGKILKLYPDTNGYLQVSLYKCGKRYERKIHRLVAEAFLSNPTNLPEVHHGKKGKQENSVGNLEWISEADHDKLSFAGEKNGQAVLTWAQVAVIRERYAHGGISQAALGKQYGVSHTNINYIVTGKHWKQVPATQTTLEAI